MKGATKGRVSVIPRVKQPVEKKQERAVLTRQRLVAAARRIFARDGFELARVEDIAAAAGKTRGAFYANFKDKEDVFFAIYEQDILRDRKQFALRLSEASTSEQRVWAFARYLSAVVKDRERMLLALEFKAYAIRHPHKHRRLADLYAAMKVRCCVEMQLDDLLPEFAGTSLEERRTQAAQVGATLDGLALNHMFDPGSLTDEQIEQQIRASLRIAMNLETNGHC